MMSLYRKCGSAKTRIVAYFMQIFIEDDLLVSSRVPNKLPAPLPPPPKITLHLLILKCRLRLRKRKKQQQQQQQHQQKQKQSNEFQSSNETRSQPK